MAIERELNYFQVEDEYNKLFQNNNLVVTKSDKMVTDEYEAFHGNQTVKGEKKIRWKLMIFVGRAHSYFRRSRKRTQRSVQVS